MARFKTVEKYDSIKKLPFKFDIRMLNSFIGYLMKKSRQINRKSLMNMYKLFALVDERIYETNPQMDARLQFIKRALDARLKHGMENEDMLINYCRSDSYNDENEEIIKNIALYTKLNYEEIVQINKIVQDRIVHAYMLQFSPQIYELAERLDAGDYNSYKEINEQMLELARDLINESRKVNVLEDYQTISLDDPDIDSALTDVFDRLKDPARILKVGIQALNQILAPGFHAKRLYMFMGLPAGFKSGILLKTARDIKKYGRDIPTKKPGKRKTVLIVTMENTVDESIERLFNMTTSPDDIRNYTTKQLLDMLRKNGELSLDGDDDVNIVIKYFPNQSIDTGDLYSIIEDIEDEGREVIALILDYIKRIRPVARSKDEKEELKNVTNELKNLAVEKDFPVITAHQLNRGAATVVDAAVTANKDDVARQLGRSNVGSAWEVIENSDWCCIINVERKRNTDQYYLTFKRVKIRYRDPNDMDYFNHPFEEGNRVKLLDDVHLETSLSEQSIGTDFEGIPDIHAAKGRRMAVGSSPTSDDDDIFDFGSAVNKMA